MTVGVVIPTFNSAATISRLLSSVFATLPPEHHVIVVDSGSSDGTAEVIGRQFPQVFLLAGDSSMWWAAATNFGILKAKDLGCSHVLTYNDDNVAMPGLFTALGEAAWHSPESIIAAVCCYMDRPDVVFFAGRMRARRSDRFYYLDHDVLLSRLDAGLREVDLLHGMCTLFPIGVFDTVGLFDAVAFPSYFADDDLALRAAKAGYRLKVALSAVVLNDRTKTGLNPYGGRLGPVAIGKILFSRKSAFQIVPKTRFLWRHRRNVRSFVKTWIYDYARLFSLIVARWVLPESTFQWAGKKWTQRLHRV
jgi:GT2 family glycosyltransferase